MDSLQYIAKKLQISKIADQEIDLSCFFPRYYQLSSSISPLYKTQFLSLAGGGSSMISSPFSVVYPTSSFFLLLYTKSGGVRLRVDGNFFSLTADSFILLSMEQAISLQSLVLPWVYEIYYIDAAGCSSYKDLLSEHINSCFVHDFPSFLPAVSMLKTFSHTLSLTDFLSIHANLTEIFSLCSIASVSKELPSSKIPSYLIEIHTLIHERYHLDFSLSSLEMQFQVSRYRICREYTRFYGISMLKDLTLQRLNSAKKMLLIPDMKIQDISSKVGYENVNHFINLFKKYFQITPGSFRQKALDSQSPSH